MSTMRHATTSTKRHATRGRKPGPASTARGQAILMALERKGLSLYAAAEQAGLSFQQVYNAIHGDPDRLTVRTVVALCVRLRLPLSVVVPQLASVA